MSSPRVDAHLHFWRYSAEEYGWIDDRMRELRRDFLPEEAATELSASGVEGGVAVQARQTLEESAWLLELARQSRFIWGVVGWVDLRSPDVDAQLSALPDLVGVRHIAQGEPPAFFAQAGLDRGIQRLTARDLSCDLLIRAEQLREATAFVDRHPEQRFILDHLGKPRIASAELEPWSADLRELALRPNVWAKLSGLVTEANWASWKAADLRPYLETAWRAFGPERLLFGSDYPVYRVAASYPRVSAIISDFLTEASLDERAQVLGGNAVTVYRLAPR
jgi:L-fuconolactonase